MKSRSAFSESRRAPVTSSSWASREGAATSRSRTSLRMGAGGLNPRRSIFPRFASTVFNAVFAAVSSRMTRPMPKYRRPSAFAIHEVAGFLSGLGVLTGRPSHRLYRAEPGVEKLRVDRWEDGLLRVAERRGSYRKAANAS